MRLYHLIANFDAETLLFPGPLVPEGELLMSEAFLLRRSWDKTYPGTVKPSLPSNGQAAVFESTA